MNSCIVALVIYYNIYTVYKIPIFNFFTKFYLMERKTFCGRRGSRGGGRYRPTARGRPVEITEFQRLALHENPVFQNQLQNVGLSAKDICLPNPGTNSGRFPYMPKPNQSAGSNDLDAAFKNLQIDPKFQAETFPDLLLLQNMPLEKQFETLVLKQTMTKEDLRVRWQLIFDIMFLSRKEYPNCQVYGFGSLFTGLADPNSDVDVFVDVNGDYGSKLQQDPNKEKTIAGIQETVLRIFSKANCPHDKFEKKFSKEVKAFGKSVLIVKMIHRATGINCDLSFGSPLSLQNSKLQKFYTQYNPVVRPFIVVLRYWAKLHGICGERRLKNFCLTLMAITYLSQKSVKQIPPCYLLQSISTEKMKFYGWNASFCFDMNVIDKYFPRPEEQSLLALLTDFFDWAGNKMNFDTTLVCPFVGEFIDKTTFLNGLDNHGKPLPQPLNSWIKTQEKLSEQLGMEKELCIQDPLCHDFNVGGSTKAVVMEKLKAASQATLQMIASKAGKLSLMDFFVRIQMTPLEIEEKHRESGGALADEILHAVFLTDPKTDCLAERKYEVLEMKLDYDFKNMYLAEMAQCGIQKSNEEIEKPKLMQEMAVLWKTFAMKFVTDFIQNGLLLDVESKICSVQVTDDGKYLGWNMDLLPNDKFVWFQKKLRFQNPIHINNLSGKLDNLPALDDNVVYMVLHVNVSYPFWDGEMKPLKNKMGHEENLNPVESQTDKSKELKQRAEKEHQNFQPFQMDVLVKLDSRQISPTAVSRPTIRLLIEVSFTNYLFL